MPEAFADTPLAKFVLALFIGALVGVEREKKQADDSSRGIGGLRTFMLVAESGAIAAWLSNELASPWIFAAGGAFVTAIVLAGYAAYVRTHPQEVGLTTEIAAVVTYLLGGLATQDEPGLAVALAIATSAVLAWKEPLHATVERIGRTDLFAALKLLIATFIVLPFLPNRTLDPWGALNPYSMWWLVILISGLSLLGYAASRVLGSGRGVPLAGLFGGLVSSTAVTLSFARRSREDSGAAADSLAAGILIAWAVMFARIGVAVAVVHAALLRPLVVPLATLTIVAAIAAAIAYRRAGRAEHARESADVPLTNPFSLTAAIRFAALFAVVLLAVKLVEHYAPGRGVYGVAALAGLTDVDAITLSMAGGARDGSVAAATAVAAIVIAALSNTVVKFGLTAALGSRALAWRVGAASIALAIAAGAALLLG